MEQPLWRESGSVIYSCCSASPAQSFSGLNQLELITSFEATLTWRARFPHLFSPGTGWPSYYLRHWVSICHFLRFAVLRWRYYNMGSSHSQSYLTTDGKSTSLSWYQATMWGPRPIFLSLPRKLSTKICGFLSVGRPLSREGGSAICPYTYYWVLPAKSHSSSSSAELQIVPYSFIWDWVPFPSSLTTCRATVEVF
jgi:hypothetical protein